MVPPVLEPLGLLFGADAAAAVQAGLGRWLAGGPAAFTLIAVDGRVHPLRDLDATAQPGLARLSAAPPDWAGLGPGPHVMAILNATPDSFSDGGDHFGTAHAVAAGERMLAQGADILDIGGESTRPGSLPTQPDIEQARVLPVIRALARQGARMSIDTRNAGTMARALDEGATIVNDVSGLRHDPGAASLVATRCCPVILMHMRGTPATMQAQAVYADVAAEVTDELSGLVARAESAGVAARHIAIDPGFGFAKDADQNLELLQRLPTLAALGRPIVVGISRKAAIGMLSNEPEARNRGPGSVAAALFALTRGARIVRVHDVAETVQAVKVWQGLTALPR